MTPTDALLRALADAGEVVADPDVLERYRRDQAAPGLVPAGRPAVLVRPTARRHVEACLRAAAELGVPVVPRGAGSGLSGGANAVDGGIVLSLERMRRVIEIDPDGLLATVEPGVGNEALRTAAAEHGLLYAPDPASAELSTIGGIADIAARHELRIATFGHAGDGNMHPTIVYDHADPEQVTRARRAFDAILALARQLGGTVSGEHGVGLLKRAAAHDELHATLDLQRQIKRAFDPTGILNPGKLL